MNTSVTNLPFLLHTSIPPHVQHWIELDQQAVHHNVAQFRAWLDSSCKIIAVIKANAYGHGLVEMAYVYEQCPDVYGLCVINLTEALTIRQAGIKKPILVIGYLDAAYELIITHNIEVIIYDFTTAEQLNEVGKLYQQKIGIHIKFDTGMSRLGIQTSDLHDFIHKIQNLPWIEIHAIFTHFAQSYGASQTNKQIEQFKQAGLLSYPVHAPNSHAVFTTPTHTYNFARIGIGLYGYLPRQSSIIQKTLRPILSLKTKILQIKTVQQGDFIGYDGMFQAPHSMTIAVIACGYHEGLDPRLSNKGKVIIRGQLAPIIGRICMNLTIIDISTISNCFPGQTVTILGKEGLLEISAYDWSALTGASVYYHMSKIAATVPKFIIR